MERDEWRRPIVYVAEYRMANGFSNSCVFEGLDAAIFFVVTGLGSYIDWNTFPDLTRKYPCEERNGTDDLSPIFRVEREGYKAQIRRTSVAKNWIVGNGIAEAGRHWFEQVTGRDIVELHGKGDALQGKV